MHHHGWHCRHAQELGNVVSRSTEICQTGRMTLGNVLQGMLIRNRRWSTTILRLRRWDVGVASRNSLLIECAGIKLFRATSQSRGCTEIFLRIRKQTTLPGATGMNGAQARNQSIGHEISVIQPTVVESFDAVIRKL